MRKIICAKKYLMYVCTLIFILLPIIASAAQPVLPKPSQFSYVYDYVDLIDAEDEQRINAIGTAIDKASKAQIIVVTVPDMGDYPIEDYALELFRSWGIGNKDKNNGVLLLVNKQRLMDNQAGKVRIEVGYGLADVIPDSTAGRILDDYVLPQWKISKYSKGILDGYTAIAACVADKYNIDISSTIDKHTIDTGITDYGYMQGTNTDVDRVLANMITAIVLTIMIVLIIIIWYFIKIKNITAIVIISIILIVMVLTNPSKQEYVSWVQEQINHQTDNVFLSSIVSLFSGSFIDNSTYTKNYIFFSVYKTELDKETKVAVVGIFKNFIPICSTP